ncbi:MAG: Sir2 silent information regulator family NAD-dependent deacetylase [Clostridia bacterium]|nr:Sir2 silent information regulator family NAD-dependent deacetylase [Clostridia bacterium]
METDVKKLREAILSSDAVVIGAGAGLSTAAGYEYGGARFRKYFGDFEAVYGFHDMYTGGFCDFSSGEETWAFWSRNIYLNRYMDAPKDTYEVLYRLVREKDYFVITTNVDHCFQRAGFAKERLFYTQGDYGLFQCSGPCHQGTYDNFDTVRQMVLSQGFSIGEHHELLPPEGEKLLMQVPKSLVPFCPRCGRPLTTNLRIDDTFVEDEGWKRASKRYAAFMRDHARKKVLYLELGVGYNTPGIIKYSFWQQVYENEEATYASIGMDRQGVPEEIRERSILIQDDADRVLREMAE